MGHKSSILEQLTTQKHAT